MKSGYIFAKFNPQDTTPVRTTDIFLCPESINSINPTLQTLLICVLSMSEYLTVKSMRITFQRFCLKFCKPTIMDKSLGTLLRFWGVFQFTQVQLLPSPHKQCWTRVSRTFSEFQLCIGWGEGSYAIIMTFETIFSTQKVFTRQFPDEPYRAHSRKLEPSTAEVGQARCFEHRAQYSVAKTHCILNIRYKFIKVTRLRYISTKK